MFFSVLKMTRLQSKPETKAPTKTHMAKQRYKEVTLCFVNIVILPQMLLVIVGFSLSTGLVSVAIEPVPQKASWTQMEVSFHLC